jgi:hypothetical protein
MHGLTKACTDSQHFPFLRMRLRVNMHVTPESSSWISRSFYSIVLPLNFGV